MNLMSLDRPNEVAASTATRRYFRARLPEGLVPLRGLRTLQPPTPRQTHDRSLVGVLP
jgi:hypothetical protein